MVVLLYVKTFFVNVNVLIRAHRLMSTAQKTKSRIYIYTFITSKYNNTTDAVGCHLVVYAFDMHTVN